jgi:PHD/YefM family antitoxin component YafN of YafNO toxin-antitoxin module
MSMARQSLFSGLIVDASDRPVDVTSVGGEAFYVIDDDGFRRHVESEYVDKQVLGHLYEMMQGHEELISEETMKMIGQEDIFTKAMIETSLKNLDNRFDELIDHGMPEEARAWLGMIGFRVVINIHGDVIRVEQPGASGEPYD